MNDALHQGYLKLPLAQPTNDFHIVQYADDTILIVEADVNQLIHLKGLLQSFATSTSLLVNYSKSSMIPINVHSEKLVVLASAFSCAIGSMPFTYLGLPMGTTKPRMEDLTPLMDRMERRLSSCSSLLSYSGCLEMLNSAITPITTYAMCTLKLPVVVLDNLDRIRKQCLWRGNDRSKKGGNLAAWLMVLKPKVKGGLGVQNLRLQNDALLLKQLTKFYNKKDIPWVQQVWFKYYPNGKVPHATGELGSFWWKDLLRLSILFRGIARCHIGDGSTVLFWDDLWSSEVFSLKYPLLYRSARDHHLSVKSVMITEDLNTLFALPLSEQAYVQFQNLQAELLTITYEKGRADSWSFLWGSHVYSSKNFMIWLSGILQLR